MIKARRNRGTLVIQCALIINKISSSKSCVSNFTLEDGETINEEKEFPFLGGKKSRLITFLAGVSGSEDIGVGGWDV